MNLNFLMYFMLTSNLKKKNVEKSVRKQYGDPDSHAFLFFRYRKQNYFFNWCLPSEFFWLYIFIGIFHLNFNKVNKVDRQMLLYLYCPDNKTV